VAKIEKRDESEDSAAAAKREETKKPTFSVDRNGESSAGALKGRDEERAVAAREDEGSNRR
jgi:hypothetical protein